jgi:hypothetical protein
MQSGRPKEDQKENPVSFGQTAVAKDTDPRLGEEHGIKVHQ